MAKKQEIIDAVDQRLFELLVSLAIIATAGVCMYGAGYLLYTTGVDNFKTKVRSECRRIPYDESDSWQKCFGVVERAAEK